MNCHAMLPYWQRKDEIGPISQRKNIHNNYVGVVMATSKDKLVLSSAKYHIIHTKKKKKKTLLCNWF